MPSCRWFWDDVDWVESALYPHNCPTGTSCPKPAIPDPPPDYGAEAQTLCE